MALAPCGDDCRFLVVTCADNASAVLPVAGPSQISRPAFSFRCLRAQALGMQSRRGRRQPCVSLQALPSRLSAQPSNPA